VTLYRVGDHVVNVRRDAVGEVLAIWDDIAWVKWDIRPAPMNERVVGLTMKEKHEGQ
jgi:hypothetical protein